MDVTYAVVNKGRRGGGAGGRDPAPSGSDTSPCRRDSAHSGCDHASSSGRDSAPPGGSTPPGSPSPAQAAADGAYEVVTPPPPPGDPRLGFNFRIPKPKGPREPPAGWARV